MLTVLTVFGTRPEAVKLAPVLQALARRQEVNSLVCVTGQHRELLAPFLELFEIEPDYDLEVMRPDQSLFALTARVLTRLEGVLLDCRPDVVLVQGDTTTALAAGLAAFYRQIPLGHVEAGLRSHDRFNPFPEEVNRCLADRLSDLLFAPTARAEEFLRGEGIPADRVLVTGNTVIDALHWVVARLPARPDPAWGLPRWDPARRLLLVTGHRRESFGADFEQICLGLQAIVKAHPGVEVVYPVHLNPHVREPVLRLLGGQERVHLIEPLGYRPFVYLMSRAHLILTDSGGVQEEAPALGVPVLVMRRVTERPEGVEAGTAKLVGTDAQLISRTALRLLASPAEYERMARAVNPYGDGQAAERIVARLLQGDWRKTAG